MLSSKIPSRGLFNIFVIQFINYLRWKQAMLHSFPDAPDWQGREKLFVNIKKCHEEQTWRWDPVQVWSLHSRLETQISSIVDGFALDSKQETNKAASKFTVDWGAIYWSYEWCNGPISVVTSLDELLVCREQKRTEVDWPSFGLV